ncbi:hypothetical protein EJ03DRAFT_297109 [Teratosphaeria nubilosa]|uniref:Uncharacterized protein n=1 Tax=Teratosphaeria nubilosa TaxID=161662 RepID=A0A6G1L2W2_9PEZI|nr:hypothetical protein EJ03DRAFT_297109 [Teratosphaeria nubilosa]
MPGVRWTEVGGLSAPLGRWTLEGGSEIIAWCYWQSTLQWVGAGGSGTTYNAHCTVWTCAKGKMRADVTPGGTVMGTGVGNVNDPNTCRCFSKLDADITFSLHD